MIGTYLIAVVGYGLTLVMAYECAAFSYRTIFVDGLDGKGSGGKAVMAGAISMLFALITQMLTGGAL